MKHYITLEQAGDNAHDSRNYDFFRSTAFMVASVADEFIERGYGQWLLKEVGHESGDTDVMLTIVDPKTGKERDIGMHYYPEGIVNKEDQDECHYFWDDTDGDDNEDTDDE